MVAHSGSGPRLEYEQLVKLFLADDHGSKDDALATLDVVRAWGAEQLDAFADAAHDYLAGQGPFPACSAVTSVSARFMVDFYAMVDQLADWTTTIVQTWPRIPPEPDPATTSTRYILDLDAVRQRDLPTRRPTENAGREGSNRP